MYRLMRLLLLAAGVLVLHASLTAMPAAGQASVPPLPPASGARVFAFGPGPAAPGVVRVSADTAYTAATA